MNILSKPSRRCQCAREKREERREKREERREKREERRGTTNPIPENIGSRHIRQSPAPFYHRHGCGDTDLQLTSAR
ncbi:MAG: hypothetical protein M1269_09255 [Chloroflexi bacterium]|nr:hypothetical protein [Chloroflexota bacterium]